MIELVVSSFFELLFELLLAAKCKAVVDVSHPKMRLLVFRGPMVNVRDSHVSRRFGRSRGERAVFPIEAREITGGLVNPLPCFSRREAHNQLLTAVPKSRHEIRMESRRAKFRFQLDAGVGVGV